MIAIGSDHGGFKLKEELKKHYKDDLKDFGAYNDVRGLDEPKVAIAVAEAVASGECEAGILICRSGIGMSIAANKVKGVRCAVCYNEEIAKSIKEHNDANVIAISEDVSEDILYSMVDKFIETPFSNIGLTLVKSKPIL